MGKQGRSRSAGTFTDVPADLDLHCLLFYLLGYGISDQKANSADLDQVAWMFWLIWIYTVRTRYKGLYITGTGAEVVLIVR
jgi:hypothetical protein